MVAFLTRSLPANTRSQLLLFGAEDGADAAMLRRLATQLQATPLPAAADLAQWLAGHESAFLLLACGHDCLAGLQLAAQSQRCLGALLLSPAGDLAQARRLPFPSLTVCHPPQAHWPRLTSTVAFASAWGSRLHTLRGDGASAVGELRLLLQALRSQNEGWPQGEL